jgi:hypothetical protein
MVQDHDGGVRVEPTPVTKSSDLMPLVEQRKEAERA